MSNSSIWLIDMNQLGASTQGQSGPGNDGNEGVLCIPQGSSITGASPSDCLVSYPGHSLVVRVVLPLGRDVVGVFYSPSWLGYIQLGIFILLLLENEKQNKKIKGKVTWVCAIWKVKDRFDVVPIL